MTRYKTVVHAKREVDRNSIRNWRWVDGADDEDVRHRLAVWLFVKNVKLTPRAVEDFIVEELKDDPSKYLVQGGVA